MNQVVLPGFKVSNQHCVIKWDGEGNSNVVVHDLSSNGTFINNTKIGKGQSRILREGNEIAFGTSVPQPHNNGLEDYRFVYRHTANGPPTEGLYAYYDLSNELGKGSFATVMKAMSRTTGEWFAVKMIHGNRNDHHVTRSTSFTREITVMEQLKHPNICELKEVFYQENNDINLVLELVEGGDLLEYILKHNGVPEVDSKHIAYQLCDALAYIHSKGITHRDLKPENVLLTKDRPPRVKVADFGLAKIVDSVTMLRTMCGTPSYLAPEVVKQENHQGYDNLVDSWSVGVIIFSMLTNAGPFIEDENQRDIRARIAGRHIDWSILENVNPSPEALSFLHALMQEDPRRRMSLKDALEHPWLQSYTPVYTMDDISHTSSSVTGQQYGEAGVTNDFIGLQIQPSVPKAKSRVLQRRSQVLSQAAEDDKITLSEPSSEMIAHAVAQERSAAGPMTRGGQKRLRGQLTPLLEESAGGYLPSGAPGASSKRGTKRPRRSNV